MSFSNWLVIHYEMSFATVAKMTTQSAPSNARSAGQPLKRCFKTEFVFSGIREQFISTLMGMGLGVLSAISEEHNLLVLRKAGVARTAIRE